MARQRTTARPPSTKMGERPTHRASHQPAKPLRESEVPGAPEVPEANSDAYPIVYVWPGATERDGRGGTYRVSGPAMVQLVPDTPVRMFTTTDGDTEARFARLFGAVWDTIPATDRDTLLRHWVTGPPVRDLPAPRIALLAEWAGRGEAMAVCSLLGHELRFWTPAVATAPGCGIALMIAHELAHALQWATGRMEPRSRLAIEREANLIARRWVAELSPTGAITPGGGKWSLASTRRWNEEHPRAALGDRFVSETWFLSDAIHAAMEAGEWPPADPTSTGSLPGAAHGTYIVLYHLPCAAKQLKVGGLGTFDFPAGYYAYLGSAFGPGGVRSRTGRHLTADTKKKWNIDWLKPLCTPVAVWWTHDRNKVEFDWAALLAALPGADIPAKKFGAAGNPKAKAHLVRFDRTPSFAEFNQRVSEASKGHAPVHEKTIENWIGHGWGS